VLVSVLSNSCRWLDSWAGLWTGQWTEIWTGRCIASLPISGSEAVVEMPLRPMQQQSGHECGSVL